MLIKVHRVCSIEEGLKFESLGADMIGVSLATDGHFDDRRKAGIELARNLARQLNRAQLVVEPPWETAENDLVAIGLYTTAHWLQVPVYNAPPPHTRTVLSKAGLEFIVSQVEADHDMEQSWVLGPVRDLGDPQPGLIELELLPFVRGSWRFLTETCHGIPEFLQVEDIEALARQAGLLLSLDLTPENLQPIHSAIPSARGFSLTLGTLADGVTGLHVFSHNAAACVVEAIGKARS